MATPPPPLTRLSTLYRLLGIEPNLEAIIDAFEPKLERIDAEGGHFDELEIAGCPALVMYGDHGGVAVPSQASFRTVMVVCAVAAVGAAVIAAFLPARAREPEPERPEPVAARV